MGEVGGPDHVRTATVRVERGFVAVCRCGRRTPPARTEDEANRLHRLHRYELPGANPPIERAIDNLRMAGLDFTDLT